MHAAKFLALADMLDGAARLSRELAQESGTTGPDEHLSELEAAKVAACSVRVLRDARRAGELPMYGRQRSRTVRREDLMRWIESRRAPIVRGVDDEDLERRVRRLARGRRGAPKRARGHS